MKLPKSVTTVTPLSKAIALFLFIMLPLLFFIIGMNFGMYGKQLEIENNTQSKIRKLQEQINSYNAELDDIINNRGTLYKQYNSRYDDRDFGLYSKLFENKTMKVTVYKYKRTLITRREIEIEPTISATTWTYELIPPNRTLSRVTFDGYENYALYGFPIDDHKNSWQKENPYVANNRTLYWNYISAPDLFSSVYLEGMLSNTINGKTIFLELKGNIDPPYKFNGILSGENKNQATIKVKNRLMKIADQIPYRKTN